ncbi:MAG: extracellular solute-binding protein [Lachnospiraceae bacterium]|nr:extracellular solute-binding protein [Lachnospiraceae bacterium]
MLKLLKKKSVYWSALIIAVIVFLLIWNGLTKKTDYSDKYKGFDFSKVEAEGRSDSYAAFLQRYKDAACPTEDITVDLKEDLYKGEGYEYADVASKKGVLKSYEDGFVEFAVTVPEAGLYNMLLTYYPDTDKKTSRGVEIQRELLINGKAQYNGATQIAFPRMYTDDGMITEDNQGNQLRPNQKEAPRWETVYIRDDQGYITEPYRLYFDKGINYIRFNATQETLILSDLTLKAVKERDNYKTYLSKMESEHGSSTASNKTAVRLEGEKATLRSEQSLFATYDRSSAVTYPYSVTKQVFNMTGGENWKRAGQWIEWECEVPADGYYEITIKARQNYNRGFVSCRSLYINGEIPFDEVSAIQFAFSSDWKMVKLADEKGKAYKFFLHKGVNYIRLEVTLGQMGDLLNRMNDSVFRMNSMYRQILVLTGTTPDENRDYNIGQKYPGVIAAMNDEYKVLYKLIDDLVAYTGEKGSQVTACLTLADQLEKFAADDAKIPKNLVAFKGNVSSLGSAILTLSDSQLDIDYIVVSGADYKVKNDTANWFQKAFHEIKAFVASFTVDYNAIGNVYGDEMETITVWIFSGRDQSTILKRLIDSDFVPKYNIGVNLDLITADVLLPATVAGTGPDVALGVAGGEPVNYALRGAACDLTQFKHNDETGVLGFDEVIAEFTESSWVPYKYGKGVYAIPETQYFNVMFYRTDIFEELNLEVPQTWDDLITILSELQKSHMDVGIPSTERKINNVANPDMNGFYAQLYQRGASLYTDDLSRVNLDSDVAIEAFEAYTKFFTHYNTPRDYAFVDRFRTGEMPIGFVDYNTFNTLCVSAPELRGLWDMALIPGTYVTDEDGNKVDRDGDGEYDIDRSVQCWGVCSMLLEKSKKHEEAWTFLQWWASADIQAQYGMELEAVMGESARYAPANMKAFDQLAWSSKQREVLLAQREWIVGTPEVPGGYYTSRHIVNAVRKVINANQDARETLLDYTRDINEEIKKKRIEFGLEKE